MQIGHFVSEQPELGGDEEALYFLRKENRGNGGQNMSDQLGLHPTIAR